MPGVRLRSKAEHVALLVVAYVPFLVSAPGRVSADSKQYLYLDPGRFLARAADLWDPAIGAGTVPHQHLGYVFPVGPWFWVFDRLGVPDWVAQRLWLGTLSAVALLGARWLFAQLGTGRSGALVGALVYGLTPYQLAFTARISVLLLPWAALPWLVGLTMRATRTRDWRAPALLAFVLVAAGGINASSLLLVAVAPVLWVAVELGSDRRIEVVRSVGRIGLLALGVSLWWLVGLRLQGAYGLPVLQLTENVRTVAEASTPGDVLRGLGNWFFYGRDRVGYSLDQAEAYTSNHLVVLLSYAIPAAGLVAAMVLRWAHRTYFGLLVVVGAVIAVGAWPYDNPSPYGSVWRSVTSETSLGLAFRNSPRVVPILVLGLAGLLAAAVGALPPMRWRRAAAAGVAVLAMGALLPVARHGFLTHGLDRPEEIPAYWYEVGAALDAGDHGTRILEIPGASFAAYEWGVTVDPVTPGLTDRPYVAREVLPYGTPASVNLLDALDRRMQQGTFEPESLAPLARLLGVGTVVLRADLDQSGRFDIPDTEPLWDALTDPSPSSLVPVETFAPTGKELGARNGPAVTLFEVLDARPIVRTAPADHPVVVAGDGDGLVDMAGAGLLDGDGLVLYGSALDPAALDAALAADARLVVTDSNRRRIQTWFYSLRDTRGPTEEVGVTAPDPTGYDVRLDPFPGTDDDSRTVVEQVGGRVSATMEGGPERPEDRAARAVDGDPATAWRVGGDPTGQSITLVPGAPLTASSVTLRQPDAPPGARRLARVRVVVNGDAPIEVDLGAASQAGAGQIVEFPEASVANLRIEVLGAAPALAAPDDPARVGLAEIGLGDVRITEVVRPPVDLLTRVGRDLEGHALDIVLTRLRFDAPAPDRGDDEARLVRRIDLPVSRSFSLRGTGRATVPNGAEPLSLVSGAGCRTDVLRLDGVALGVLLEATPSGGWSLRACTPLALSAGSHVLEAQPRSPLTVDRLVLSTTASGRPAPQSELARGTVGSSVRVVDQDASSFRLQVESDGEPFWLVLGQSNSDGWVARTAGGQLGDRQLVDGYANGWLVTPDAEGRFTIDLRWEPQRLVWVGGALSALAVLGAGGLLLGSRRRSFTLRPLLTAPPSLVGWAGPGSTLALQEAVVVAAVVVVGAFLVASPVVAVLAGVSALAAALVPVGSRGILLLGPLALVVSRVGPRPSVAWLAVAVLGADLLVGTRRVRRSQRRRGRARGATARVARGAHRPPG